MKTSGIRSRLIGACVILAGVLFACDSLWAQGTILFNNDVPGVLNKRFFFPEGNDIPVSPGWTAQLFLLETDGKNITPLFPTTTIQQSAVGAGYLVPTVVTVPNHPPGSEASLLIAIFNTPDYHDALACIGNSPPGLKITLGGGDLPPGYLIGLTSPGYVGPICENVIPEPSTFVLVGLGLLASGLRFCLLRKRSGSSKKHSR